MKTFLSRHIVWISTPLVALAIFIVWQAYVKFFKVSPLILPTPMQVAHGVVALMADPDPPEPT